MDGVRNFNNGVGNLKNGVQNLNDGVKNLGNGVPDPKLGVKYSKSASKWRGHGLVGLSRLHGPVSRITSGGWPEGMMSPIAKRTSVGIESLGKLTIKEPP